LGDCGLGNRRSAGELAAPLPRGACIGPRGFRFGEKSAQNPGCLTPLVLALQNVFRVLLVVTVMADLMKAPELKERLKKIPEWELEKKHIERTFEFDDFADAIDFVNAIAVVLVVIAVWKLIDYRMRPPPPPNKIVIPVPAPTP